MHLIRFLEKQFQYSLRRDISEYPISLGGILEINESAVLDVIKLLFLAQVECERSEEFLPSILDFTDETKNFVAQIVEEMRLDPRVHYSNEHLNDEQHDYVSEIDGLRQRGTELNQQILLSQQRESALEKRLGESYNQLDDCRRQLSAMRAQNTNVVGSRVEAYEKSIEVYKENITMLENKIKSFEDHERSRVIDTNDAITRLTGDIHVLEQERDSLRLELDEARVTNARVEAEAQEKEKELGQFVMTGGALGGQMRDRIIRTLQEQLMLRDEEIEKLRQRKLEGQDEQRKGERLLVSAVHAIAMKYHDEMVKRLHEGGVQATSPRVGSPSDFYSQEYHNSP